MYSMLRTRSLHCRAQPTAHWQTGQCWSWAERYATWKPLDKRAAESDDGLEDVIKKRVQSDGSMCAVGVPAVQSAEQLTEKALSAALGEWETFARISTVAIIYVLRVWNCAKSFMLLFVVLAWSSIHTVYSYVQYIAGRTFEILTWGLCRFMWDLVLSVWVKQLSSMPTNMIYCVYVCCTTDEADASRTSVVLLLI